MLEEKNEDVMKVETVCVVEVDALEVVRVGAVAVLVVAVLVVAVLVVAVLVVAVLVATQEILRDLVGLGAQGFNPKRLNTFRLQEQPYSLFQQQ
jgi:hypothetical protein